MRDTGHPGPSSGPFRFLRGGTVGNARLTAICGLIIIVLLAAEGMTILAIRPLFGAHAFIGFLVIPPIGLKLASTGYRFVAYYVGNARYRAAGPPHPIPRILAPFLVASTVGLFASGVVLLFLGPQGSDPWRQIHTVIFILWFFLMSAHVLTYLWRALSLTYVDLAGGRPAAAGVLDRSTLCAGALLLGVVVAVIFLPWDATWSHALSSFQHDG